MKKADESHRRRQLIFSRWVLVMTAFESELYRDPSQDLNKLWWDMVEKYQKIPAPKNRTKQNDWAAKYHIGLAPVYYFSYLSQLQNSPRRQNRPFESFCRPAAESYSPEYVLGGGTRGRGRPRQTDSKSSIFPGRGVLQLAHLLGELFASSIQEALAKKCGSPSLSTAKAGKFLQEKLFKPGNRMS